MNKFWDGFKFGLGFIAVQLFVAVVFLSSFLFMVSFFGGKQ